MSLHEGEDKSDISEVSIREELAEQLWKGLVWLAIIGAPASALRTIGSGWRWIYGVHFCLGILVALFYFNRQRFDVKIKIGLAILVPFFVGLPALLTFGFYSSAVAWVAVSCVAAAMFYSKRVVLVIVCIELLVVALAGLAFSAGYLVMAITGDNFVTHIYSWLPIFFGTTVAVITLTFGVNTYNESIRSLLNSLQVQRDEIANQRDIIHHQATHDSLTGLPTLRLARDRLDMACSQAKRDKNKAAVFFIDLDGFKEANDTYGHDAGDYVLRVIADRLMTSIRVIDTAARLGGDEFVVIMFGIDQIEDTRLVAEKLIKVISEPIYYEQHEVKISASIGIAVFPDHAASAEATLKHADEAMYAVKKMQKNNYTFYSESSQKTA